MIKTISKIGRGILTAIGIIIGWIVVLGFVFGVIFSVIELIQGFRLPLNPYSSVFTVDILPLAIPLMILIVWVHIKITDKLKQLKEKRRDI